MFRANLQPAGFGAGFVLLRVISRDLAARLAPLLNWKPANGDRFYVPKPEIADSVFTISDMVVESGHPARRSRFHFNGTVEWALDSVESDEVVWLPREDQLRGLLGDYFLSLDSLGGAFVVTVIGPGRAFHTDPEADASDAYGQALLYVLQHARSAQPLDDTGGVPPNSIGGRTGSCPIARQQPIDAEQASGQAAE